MCVDALPDTLIGKWCEFLRSKAPSVETLIIWHLAQYASKQRTPSLSVHTPGPVLREQLPTELASPLLNIRRRHLLQSVNEGRIVHRHEQFKDLKIRLSVLSCR